MVHDLDESNAVGKKVGWYVKYFLDHILQMLPICNLVYIHNSHILYLVSFFSLEKHAAQSDCCLIAQEIWQVRCTKSSMLARLP